MVNATSYTRRNLELRAAEYYMSIRKQEDEWKSLADLVPQLNEFEHLIRAGDCIGAYQVLESISDHLSKWGQYAWLVKMREKLLEQKMGHGLQMDNASNLGYAYYVLGQFKQANSCYEEALAIAQETGNRSKEGIVLGRIGRVFRAMGSVEQAIEAHKQSLSIALELGEHQQESAQLGDLGSAYRYLGQIEKAIDLYKQALDITQEIVDPYGEGVLLGRLGLSHNYLGNFKQALAFDEEALRIFQDIGDRRQESIELDHLGLAHYGLGETERSIDFYKQALAITREIGYRRGESRHLMRLGKALLIVGARSIARQCSEESLALDIPDINYQAALTLSIALLHEHDPVAQNAFTDAVTYCTDMLTKTEGVYEPHYTLATALVGQAICNPRWADESQRLALLVPALFEYRHALDITLAPGIVRDTLRDLELIRAAGVEGLEPVFALLEQVLNADTPATNDAPDLSTA